MSSRSVHLANLTPNYLFSEIETRTKAYLAKNPGARILPLGIGDTTAPLPQVVAKAIAAKAGAMAESSGYVGYGPAQGVDYLRKRISVEIYGSQISDKEITISDGVKPDLGRIAALTGGGKNVAVQDPAYPVYLESSHIVGNKVTLLPATEDNDFFPDWCSLKGPHYLFICSPNNPTGVAATKEQLQKVVNHARKEGMIILFDAAYSAFISDDSLPHSIYEIEGARECAIEFGSFSKSAGLSGIRLGWCVVPKELKYASGQSVSDDWNRALSSLFNGPCILSQEAGYSALSAEGKLAYQPIIKEYLENAKLLRECFEGHGLKVFGGKHAPFLWVDFQPHSSWDVFDHLLEQYQIVTTPGSGFGEAGEGYVRFSALGKRADILEAIERLRAFNIDNIPKPPSRRSQTIVKSKSHGYLCPEPRASEMDYNIRRTASEHALSRAYPQSTSLCHQSFLHHTLSDLMSTVELTYDCMSSCFSIFRW